MIKEMRYQDLNHALRNLRKQVMDGIEYAQNDVKPLDTPQQVWNYLKPRTVYKNDPKNTELFQTLPTLMENNFHGVSGAGDCDCFTIAALTLLLANGMHDCGIVLVGRKKYSPPVHIYAYAIDDDGKKKYLDLTNRYFDYERDYPYKQEIQFKLSPKEKENMMLQLAELGARGRYINVSSYKRSPYVKGHKRKIPLNEPPAYSFNPYVYMPSKGVQVREDYFDDMPLSQVATMLAEEGYSMQEIQQLASRRDRRIKRKESRQAARKEKKASRSDVRRARAEKKRLTGQAKLTKSQGGGFDWGKLVDTAGGVIGKFTGGGSDSSGVTPDQYGGYNIDAYQNPSVNTQSVIPDESTLPVKGVKKNEEPKEGFFEGSFNILGISIPKPVAYIGGAALLYGGYKLTTIRRRAA